MSDDVFATERPRLLGLAYRMLGSMTDAEDVVQDAWLRWERADRGGIENPAAWVTTVTTRLALDRLRRQRRDRERYVGPWLPEPVLTDDATDPEHAAELAESLTLGFLVLLDELSPTERAVLLLADVFGHPFAVVAAAVGRSEAACRQIAHRARARVRAAHRPAPSPSAERARMAARFRDALATGDLSSVLALLAPDVRLVSDGGAAFHAARRPVIGAERVSRFLVNIVKRVRPSMRLEVATVNGEAGFVLWHRGRPLQAVVLETDGEVISTIRVVVNPQKLAALAAHPPMA